MNRFNKMNDDELKSFMKENQPVAPVADSTELNVLMRKLKIENKSSESSSLWLWLATGLAASLFMFQFLTSNPALPEAPVATVAATAVLVEDDDEFTAAADVSTLDIGEEYLTLAGY